MFKTLKECEDYCISSKYKVDILPHVKEAFNDGIDIKIINLLITFSNATNFEKDKLSLIDNKDIDKLYKLLNDKSLDIRICSCICSRIYELVVNKKGNVDELCTLFSNATLNINRHTLILDMYECNFDVRSILRLTDNNLGQTKQNNINIAFRYGIPQKYLLYLANDSMSVLLANKLRLALTNQSSRDSAVKIANLKIDETVKIQTLDMIINNELPINYCILMAEMLKTPDELNAVRGYLARKNTDERNDFFSILHIANDYNDINKLISLFNKGLPSPYIAKFFNLDLSDQEISDLISEKANINDEEFGFEL